MKETDINKWTTLMIEKIESLGSKDGWQKPWFTEGTLSWPKNLSGREYNGVFLSLLPSFNLLLLQTETFDIVHSLVKRIVYRITQHKHFFR